MKVYFDSNYVIYLVEQQPTWFPKVLARVMAFRSQGDELILGDLTRAECLVGPMKQGHLGLELRYRALFNDPDWQVVGLTASVCELAARLRAQHNLHLLDCLHLASAVEHGCGLFLTNDALLTRCTAIPVEVLT